MGGSWASDASQRDAWIAFANRLCGRTFTEVRYYNLDYRRWDVAREVQGPRLITDPAEWGDPTFECPGGHTLDWGLELVGHDGETCCVTWDPPSAMSEGIAIHEESFLSAVLSPEADPAVWDVTERAPWNSVLNTPVTDVEVHYEPWDDSGAWWCIRVDFIFGTQRIEILEAEGLPDGTIGPSADNIVVRFGQ